MGKTLDVFISPDGTMQFVHSDDLSIALLGNDFSEATTKRASHVEPDGNGGWTADLGPVSGPLLGPFRTRTEALDAELTWLAEEMTKRTLEAR